MSTQYPKVRALTVCLACGGGKSIGLLVCWPCHNDLSVAHEHGYGMIMDRVIQVIDTRLAAAERATLPSALQPFNGKDHGL